VTFRIKKGRHRARPLYWLRWWPLLWNPYQVARRVTFSFSCKYTLEGDDQYDTNKLFGIAYGGVHRESARFGWRYDPDRYKFVLSAYCYVKGQRTITDLCEVVANHAYDCWIIPAGGRYIFEVCRTDGLQLALKDFPYSHKRKIAFLLGLFFGGNQPSPHDMTIQLKKI
jgi:hypothetical protein